ncbi:hypothetical protein QYE76_008868 [Lolium multiflorum]|uniref:Transposase-associated domain-containing protein n=1 Tax=Lolium multiflorum TaxID=4521 RepID=A0AAD8TS30_LOLMU|nr:hypothetical protein QYE76_008868 [Lolium multiflorum]
MTGEWIQKTKEFIESAFDKKRHDIAWCPCRDCGNKKQQTKETVGKHLVKYGFTPFYHTWDFHGETKSKRARTDGAGGSHGMGEFDTGIDDCLEDFRNAHAPENPVVEETQEEGEKSTKQFYEALFAAQKPLHELTEEEEEEVGEEEEEEGEEEDQPFSHHFLRQSLHDGDEDEDEVEDAEEEVEMEVEDAPGGVEGGEEVDGYVEGELAEELWTGEELAVLSPPLPEGRKVYLRGNAKLPARPYAQKHIQLEPKGKKCLIHVGSVRPSRLPSGILGCLIREHYPGLVKLPDGTCEPAWTYNHYKFAKDNSKYPNVASRVVNEFWEFFTPVHAKRMNAATWWVIFYASLSRKCTTRRV